MKGFVIKRGQYARDRKTKRRFPRIKTVAGLLKLLKYFDDDAHPNHEGIKIVSTKYWCCTPDGFVTQIEAQRDAYIASSVGKQGRPWSGDIAEHVILAPPPKAELTEVERTRIVDAVLQKLSPFSPAAYVWHYDEEQDRWDLHLAISSFESGYPRLRVSEVRNRCGTDYRLAMDEMTADIAHALNLIRNHENRAPIQTLGGLTAGKKCDLVGVLVNKAIGCGLTAPTIADLLDLFATGCHWKVVKHSTTSVTVRSADYSTPLHIRWLELLRAVAEAITHDRDQDGRGKRNRQLGF